MYKRECFIVKSATTEQPLDLGCGSDLSSTLSSFLFTGKIITKMKQCVVVYKRECFIVKRATTERCQAIPSDSLCLDPRVTGLSKLFMCFENIS